MAKQPNVYASDYQQISLANGVLKLLLSYLKVIAGVHTLRLDTGLSLDSRLSQIKIWYFFYKKKHEQECPFIYKPMADMPICLYERFYQRFEASLPDLKHLF